MPGMKLGQLVPSVFSEVSHRRIFLHLKRSAEVLYPAGLFCCLYSLWAWESNSPFLLTTGYGFVFKRVREHYLIFGLACHFNGWECLRTWRVLIECSVIYIWMFRLLTLLDTEKGIYRRKQFDPSRLNLFMVSAQRYLANCRRLDLLPSYYEAAIHNFLGKHFGSLLK